MIAVSSSHEIQKNAIKEYIVPVLSGVLIVFGAAVPVLTIACFLLNVVYIVLANPKAVFKLLFALLPFAQVYKVMALGGTSFFTYLEVLFCVVCLFKMGRIKKEFLILFVFWAMYVLVGSQLNILMWVKQLMIPLLICFFFQMEKPTFKEIVRSLTIGLLLSSVLALFHESIPNLTDMMRLTRVWEAEDVVYRFSGLYPDPNYYTMVVILCVLSMLLLFSARRMGAEALVLSAVLIYFGARTASKSFILMLAAVAVMLVVTLFLQKRTIAAIGSLIIVCLAGAFVLTGSLGLFDNVLLRLKEGMEGMTTGRVGVWATYLAYLNENWLRWFLGSGINAGYLQGYAAHNSYIDFLYYYGLIGTTLFFATCIAAVGKKENRSGLIQVMPLLCLMTMNVFLSSVDFFDFAFNLIFVFYALQTDFSCLAEQRQAAVQRERRLILKTR